jgi:glycosyltransferase involved in cell wall biosynthesis
VEPAVDARVDLGVPGSCPLIGMVANFAPEKDHELFLAMAELIRAKRPEAHFVLIGDGPRRAAIQRLVVDRGLGDAFRFVTGKDRLRPYYEAMDAVVLTSKTEGLPNVVLEAMAYGRPIVAATAGGIPEVVSDRVTGRLIASRAPQDFADAVLELLEKPDDAARMGRQAAVYALDRFSVGSMAQAYRALYLKLLAAKRGAA